jgi:hypothetical protein
MTRHRLLLAISVAALLAGGAVAASEIYKWTDENGSVHYEDRPTGEGEVQRMNIVSARTDNSAVQARLQARREERAAREQVASEAPPEMSKEEIRAEQEKRQQQCQKYRDRLEAFLRSQRLYEENDTGERRYLDEQEVMAARAKVQEQIVEYCGS